jgi:hypothetical protein
LTLPWPPTLKTELITLHAEGAKSIILDLSEVNYTDSSGLSSLLVGNRTFHQDGGYFYPGGVIRTYDETHQDLPT